MTVQFLPFRINGRKFFYWLSRGRPMKWQASAFVDSVSGRTVSVYKDDIGLRWMATSRWSIFRIAI